MTFFQTDKHFMMNRYYLIICFASCNVFICYLSNRHILYELEEYISKPYIVGFLHISCLKCCLHLPFTYWSSLLRLLMAQMMSVFIMARSRKGNMQLMVKLNQERTLSQGFSPLIPTHDPSST